MSDTLIGRPSDVITDSGTVALTAGAANASYPLTNSYDRKSYTVFKSTGATCTIRVTFGGARTLQALGFINCNATAIQVTNGAGFNQAISIPTTPEDGLRLDPGLDCRALANTSSTTWDFAFTAATTVALGELLLVETARVTPIMRDAPSPMFSEAHPTITHLTDYGVALKYGMGVRDRTKSGHIKRQSYEAQILSLKRDARGSLKPFLLWWDTAVNDLMWAYLESDRHDFTLTGPSESDVDLVFREQQKGLAV